MKKPFWLLLFFCTFTACDVSDTQDTTIQSTAIQNDITARSGDYTVSSDSARIDTTDLNGPQNSECIDCIDPPGDGDPTVCTPTNDYALSATLNNTTVSTISDDIPTWRLAPFWGGIIGEVETVLENTRQTDSPFHRELPYHETFDLDRRVTIETTLMPMVS